MAAVGPIAIHYSAAGADNIWRRGEFNKVREWCKIVRDTGRLVGVNGHLPEAFMKMEDEGWDVDFYMPGLYIFGRTQAEWAKLYEAHPDLAPLKPINPLPRVIRCITAGNPPGCAAIRRRCSK